MASEIRVAWIGTAHIHTPGFTDEALRRGYSAAGVWDHDEARASKNAEKLKTEVRSLEELANDSSVTGYVVCSETNRHPELVAALAPTKKPIFVEKPMGTDGAVSETIQAAFESTGAAFQTGYFMRGQRSIRTLRRLVSEGFFGQSTRVRASNCHSGALKGWFDTDWRWMADRSQSGVGAFGDLGTHVLDLLLWIFGDVKSVTGTFGAGIARYPGCEETGEAILRFSNGVIGTMAAGWDDVANPVLLQVMGTKGHALLGKELQLAGEDGKFATLEELDADAPAGIHAFFNHLEGKPADLVSAAEAAIRDRVMSAIYHAADSETWVQI